jgi:hypothetical protein
MPKTLPLLLSAVLANALIPVAHASDSIRYSYQLCYTNRPDFRQPTRCTEGPGEEGSISFESSTNTVVWTESFGDGNENTHQLPLGKTVDLGWARAHPELNLSARAKASRQQNDLVINVDFSGEGIVASEHVFIFSLAPNGACKSLYAKEVDKGANFPVKERPVKESKVSQCSGSIPLTGP